LGLHVVPDQRVPRPEVAIAASAAICVAVLGALLSLSTAASSKADRCGWSGSTRNSGTSTAPVRDQGDDQPGGAAAKVMSHNDQGTRVLVLVRMRTTMLSGHRSGYQQPRIPMAAVGDVTTHQPRPSQSRKAPGHRSHSPVMAPAVLTPPGASWLADIRFRELGEGPRGCSAPSGWLGQAAMPDSTNAFQLIALPLPFDRYRQERLPPGFVGGGGRR
jgi:hypothetical protein